MAETNDEKAVSVNEETGLTSHSQIGDDIETLNHSSNKFEHAGYENSYGEEAHRTSSTN